MPNARTGSATMSRTRQRGLSDAYGSWKIMFIRRRSVGLGARGREGLALEADFAPARRIEPDREARDGGLAAAALAHQRQRGATRDGEGYVIDRAQRAARLARQRALQPRLRDIEQLVTRTASNIGAGPASSSRAGASGMGGLRSSRTGAGLACSQQAARVAPACNSSGRSTRQRSNTLGQRGLKAHPAGSRSRRGIAPSICRSRSTLMLDRGNAAHQPFGVGMRRAASRLPRTGPISSDAARHT